MSEEKETAAETKAPRAKAEKKAADAMTVVYIGPNRLTEGLKKYTVYRGMPTDIIAQASEKHKNVARLFVPVDDLGDAMAQAQKKGTPIYLAYHEMEKGV